MAYAAVADVIFTLDKYVIQIGPWFSPPSLKMLIFALKELRSFHEFLSGLDGSSRKRMNASLRRITEGMYNFNKVLSRHLIPQRRAADDNFLSFEVESRKQEFDVIFDMMKKIKEERFNGDAAGSGGNKPKMVGLSDVYNKFKQEIVLPRSRETAVFFLIVGMAGIGKTALAEAIFQDLDILERFEIRVWVSVGKNCRQEEISRRILAQLNPDRASKLAEGDGNAGTYIQEILEGVILKGKRWLIVMDDVWEARVCEHIERILPYNLNASRFIVTSRSRRVAEHAEFISEMRLLNEKESWVLLREKVLGEKYCPPELEETGKKIAEKCDGLPLTIVTVADLLSKISESLWIDVATRRKHQIFIDAYDEISKVLYPSYEDIPQHLKLNFLYMAVFPPNYKISRSRLINMWFVEGLLESNASKSSTYSADECLEEFSSNSLVMVYQKRTRSSLSRSIKETKNCGLHSSWWHLCYTEARKNNFFYVLISREDCLENKIKSQSRLSIHNNILFAIKDVYDSMEKNSASTACSLLCLGPYHRYPVPICFGLRFLENLDAQNIRLYEFPLEVLELSGLKYFSLTCDGELPASISKLQNLQFFIVRRHHNIKVCGAPSYLPVEIWDMKELKHFQIMGSDLPDDLCDTILPNLSTLLDVSGHSCTKGIFERMPHLKKLGIRIELTPNVVEPMRCFYHISQLNDLEILKCVVTNPGDHMFRFVSLPTSLSIFPLSLIKLTLSGFGYPWEEMSKIASLPCLEVLKLRCDAFRGRQWKVEENSFPKLRCLFIEDINLTQWEVGIGSFKELEFISIKHCYKLNEVRWKFNATAINKIEVVDCNPSLEVILRSALLRQDHLADDFSVESSWEAKDLK